MPRATMKAPGRGAWLRGAAAAVLAVAALAAAACSGDDPPDTADDGKLVVAGVQYGEGDHADVADCADDVCGVAHFVRQAAEQGAEVIVTPEYAFGLRFPERVPDLGDNPGTGGPWHPNTVLRQMSLLAAELGVTLIVTQVSMTDDNVLRNTQVAFDGDGAVIALHHKFHLFGNELDYLTAGTSVDTSTFDTELGLAGMLICADIQCVVAGVGPDCKAAEQQLLDRFTARQPRIVFFSAKWTVGPGTAGSEAWWPLNVQRKYAVAAETYVVAANTTAAPGQGAGIFAPGGDALASTEATSPGVIVAEIAAP